jgi:endo-1,4-beta-xylanase
VRVCLRRVLSFAGQEGIWFISGVLLGCAAFAAEPSEIALWSKGAPGSEGLQLKETVENVGKDRVERRVSNVTNPTIAVYLPSKDSATGAAVIVAPGGGHRFLSFDHEGHDVAKWLSSIGVVAVVLKYRLARVEGVPFQVETHALQDTQRAIRMVRSLAKEWGVDSRRVGILGFSAGGELAALAATRFDNGIEGASDPIDREPSRPDFQALLYPGLPREQRVSKEMPPTFLCAAQDDRPSISEGLAEYYLAVKRAGVPVELHLFASGGHGFGIRPTSKPVAQWPARLKEWMTDRGFLTRR